MGMTINTKDLRAMDLLEMSQAELDKRYPRSPTGAIPVGEAKGTVIVMPGTPFARKRLLDFSLSDGDLRQ
jgi:hypothetical protein